MITTLRAIMVYLSALMLEVAEHFIWRIPPASAESRKRPMQRAS